MKFSEKLTDLRKRAGFSQEELAEKLGVSRQAVSRWEAGSTLPDAVNLLNLSDLFSVSVDTLLRDEMSTDKNSSKAGQDAESAASAFSASGEGGMAESRDGWRRLPEQDRSRHGTYVAVYVIYTAMCVLSCHLAGVVQEAMRHQINLTYRPVPYTCVTYAAYVVLGLLWAGEMLMALRVRKRAMLAVRVITMLTIVLLGIGWAVAMMLSGGTAPAWLWSGYANGAMPAYALIAGFLAVSTVWLVCRRTE